MGLSIIILLLVAYTLGSIPSAVWVGKRFHGIDVREHGSGNAGATNTFRVLGKKTGIPVLLLDILKGFLAVKLVLLQSQYTDLVPVTNLKLAFGFCAVIGHIFPVFAGFRGGKGIATLLGIVLAVHPPAALCSLALFVVVLTISKYVSLGSMIAGISFPFFVSFAFPSIPVVPSLVIFSSVVALLVIITHQKNIQRLLKHNENKTYLFGKRHKIAGLNEEQEVDEFSK